MECSFKTYDIDNNFGVGKMMKKTISLLLIFMMIFTMTMSSNAFGVDKNNEKSKKNDVMEQLLDDNSSNHKTVYSDAFLRREVKAIGIEAVKIFSYFLGGNKQGNEVIADLIIDKPGSKVENRIVKNLYITKEVGNGEVVIRNVEVTGELIVEGGGQNSIMIEDSAINKLITNKKDGKVRILIKGNTSVDSTSVKSSAILEQYKLTGHGFEEVTVNENTSVLLAVDKKVKWKSSNDLVASVNEEGVVTAREAGKSIISVETRDGRKTEICGLNVFKSDDDTADEKAIKILSIGNSFSQDASHYVYDIAKSAGVNVVVGNIYFAGCSLKTHWTNASKNNAAYKYYKWTASGMTEKEKQTVTNCILDEKWDYIVFQQASGESGFYDTYQPYLNKLIAYVKGLSTNSEVKMALNMTWAYANDSAHAGFINYDNNQISMYYSIVNAYRQAISETGIDILIPCGTAIQNARTNESLCNIGDELTLDGYHLNEGIGRYIAGLAYFETLVVKQTDIKKDLFTDVSFYPDKSDCNEQLAYMSKISVMDAVMNPFEITKFINK